jgi:hypothetical protein
VRKEGGEEMLGFCCKKAFYIVVGRKGGKEMRLWERRRKIHKSKLKNWDRMW